MLKSELVQFLKFYIKKENCKIVLKKWLAKLLIFF